MTVMEFFGCTLIAFGPPTAMFACTIATDPIRIIILIASAFFWLLSLLLSSLLWFAVVPLREQLVFGLAFSVIFQEVFRLILYIILRKAENGLKKVTDENMEITNDRHVLAYVSGLGFGLMSGAFSLVNVLADSIGPGTVGFRGDSNLFFITSAFTTLAFILLHTFWGIIVFHYMDNRKYWNVGFVFMWHMSASLLTLSNQMKLYVATLVPIYVITCCTGIWAYFAAGGNLKNLKSCRLCKPTRLLVED